MLPRLPHETPAVPAAAAPTAPLRGEGFRLSGLSVAFGVVFAAIAILFPPGAVGGFGSVGHLIWSAVVIVGSLPFMLIMSFGFFFAFKRSNTAGNAALCVVIACDIVLLGFTLLMMPGLEKARGALREFKAEEQGVQVQGPRPPSSTSVSAAQAAGAPVKAAPAKANAAKPARKDRPAPVVTVRKSSSRKQAASPEGH